MARKAKSKKIVYKKGPSRKQIAQNKKGRIISFFVGVVTVSAIAFAIFQVAQTKNYKQILGEKTKIETQTSNVK